MTPSRPPRARPDRTGAWLAWLRDAAFVGMQLMGTVLSLGVAVYVSPNVGWWAPPISYALFAFAAAVSLVVTHVWWGRRPWRRP